MTRDEIIAAYRRFAKARAPGPPPGMKQFLRAYPELNEHIFRSGYWRGWRAFQAEAGVIPNEKVQRLPERTVMEGLARLTRTIGRVPTDDDLTFARRSDPTIPGVGAVRTRASSPQERASVLREFCEGAEEWQDVLDLLPEENDGRAVQAAPGAVAGYVYLMKHGSRYKIGRSNSVGRREYEAATWLSNPKVIHRIATDDPEGVERYWHRRFEDKSIEREWFALNANDVAAFRRWKKIV